MPPEQQFKTPEPESKKNWFIWFCVVLILIGLSVAGYFKYERHQIRKSILSELKSSDEQLQSIKQNQKPRDDSFSDWQNYRSEKYGFEFMYPQGWLVTMDMARYPDSSAAYQRYIVQRAEDCYASIIFKDPSGPEKLTYSLSSNSEQKFNCQKNLDLILNTFKFIN